MTPNCQDVFRGPLIAILSIVFFGFWARPGLSAEGINDYLKENGSCKALAGSWEREFHRSDNTPFGKELTEWQPDDYAVVRRWVEECIDPWVAVAGRREVFMQGVDHSLQRFQQNQQQQLDAIARRGEQARQAQQRQQTAQQLGSLLGQQLASIEVAQTAFKAQENSLFQSRAPLQLANVDSDYAEAETIRRSGLQLNLMIANANVTGESLARTGSPPPPLPDPVNLGPIQARLQEFVKFRVCGPLLGRAGVPQVLITAKVFSGSGNEDGYLFDFVCMSNPPAIRFSSAGWLSNLYRIDLGTNVSSLWFDFKDDDGSGTWATNAGPSPSSRARLFLRRFKSGSIDEEATTNWEAANLLNSSLAITLLNR